MRRNEPEAGGGPRRVLSLFDTTNLIVGIIVGAGIFVAAPVVARGIGSGVGVLAIWFVGGLLSFCGAVGYAELATTYPEQGGDYVYLTKAYGRWAGFLFGWLQTLVVRPGDIAVMAFVFATYAENLVGHQWIGKPVLAAAAVAVLTAVNVAGVRSGVRTQNVLTVAKVIGVSLVIVVAVLGPGAEAAPVEELTPEQPVPLAIALVLVLFSFGGWNETAFVAAEVREPRRNIVRAMVLGMAVVTVIYLAVNASFLHVLGFHGLASSEAVAAETVASVFPEAAASMVSALICLCALGAVNGLVFAGARIAYAVGRDHRLFGALGRWSERTGTPVRALILQGSLSVVLILVLGSFIDTVMYTAAAVYLFYLATSVAVIVLRFRDRSALRAYKATGYPVTTVVFCLVCLFLIAASVQYRPWIAVAAGLLILLGVPGFWLSERGRR
ncbi:MAG: amino acid permease [Acidobacteriota bacterium]|nr:amino acid permease [Acidobacteriota bacterium]